MNRFSARRVPPALWLTAAFGTAVIIVLGTALLAPQLAGLGRPVSMVVVAALIVGGGVFGCLHWRGLDEPAREAHKSAWFWGGSAGFAFFSMALVVLMLFTTAGDTLADYVNANRGHIHPTTFAILMGFLGCFVAQMVGYALAWGRWWLKRRG
jgi:hypothetical protein